MEKAAGRTCPPLQGGNPRPGIYGGLCLIRPCGVTFPEGEGKGGKEVPMPKIYFHVDVNSAFFFVLVGAQGAARRSTVDLRTIPAVVGGDEAKRHGVVLAKSTPAKNSASRRGRASLPPASSARG